MNWRKMLAWIGALALTTGVLLWISRPPAPEPDDIVVKAQPAAESPKPILPPRDSMDWQIEEFTNRLAKAAKTNVVPGSRHEEALEIQSMIIQQQGRR